MKCLLLLVCLHWHLLSFADATEVFIDADKSGVDFKHFWKSTGLCPPDPKEEVYKYLLSDEEKVNLALIGASPNRAIGTVRVHWLLNIILFQGAANDSFNFELLDDFLDHLNKHDLYPGFELMGYPLRTQNFTHLPKVKNRAFWQAVTIQIFLRYNARYGLKTVSQWKFETWNEPDLPDYNILNFTSKAEFLEYVKGCADIKFLHHPQNISFFRIGGPAGLFQDRKQHPFCWGVLEYCRDVGAADCPVDYISFHSKGDGTARAVVDRSLGIIDEITKQFPTLNHLPFANDEADIILTWSNSHEWLADTRYAAMIIQVIEEMYEAVTLDRKREIEVLSNDNAFLNFNPYFFTQRTLFARFQMNNTRPAHNQFIKKPVYLSMALLSLLGDRHLKNNTVISDRDPLLTVIPTRTSASQNESRIATILAYHNNSEVDLNVTKHIKVHFTNLKVGSKYSIYQLNNEKTNPYAVWQQYQSPVFPSRNLRQIMRNVEEPYRPFPPLEIKTPNVTFNFSLTTPSVVLINICEIPTENIGTVTKVNILNVTENEVLITWSDNEINTKCIRTYEVDFESKCRPDSGFRSINVKDSIFLSLQFDATREAFCGGNRALGRYRVRAVDYWDRRGNFSEIVSFL